MSTSNEMNRPPPRTLSGRRLSVSRQSSSRSSGNLSQHGSGGSGRRLSATTVTLNDSSSDTPPAAASRGGFPPIRWIQDRLDFRGCADLSQFSHPGGFGRVATLASILGAVFAIHAMALIQLYLHEYGIVTISIVDNNTADNGSTEMAEGTKIPMIRQWLQYVVILTLFHLLEFFVTAIYNPSVTTADSFVVNQSMAYTTAALVSWIEFWIRFAFFPSVNSPTASRFGLVLVIAGQIVRALAMMTCAESFNHLIQQTKKDNHVLITHGIYKYLRHPSYVGFYYWSVGTQLLLCNFISFVCYIVASWYFFKRRIPFEEETLVRYFPDEYPAYVASTWSGLPFIWSKIATEEQVSFSAADGFKKMS